MARSKKPDTILSSCPGSNMWVLTPLSKAGKAWVEENVQYEDWQMIGASGISVDQHYVQNLLDGMQGDGLTVGKGTHD